MRRQRPLSLIGFLALLACSRTAGSYSDSTRTDRSVVSTRSDAQTPGRCEEVEREGGPCVLWGPSLIELIARPELYDGKRVRVIGFVNFEFEGNALYVSREDWLQSIPRNGVWLDPRLALPTGIERDTTAAEYRPNRRYALVEGTFREGMTGHLGMWSGSIDSITRIQVWGRQNEPAPARRPQ